MAELAVEIIKQAMLSDTLSPNDFDPAAIQTSITKDELLVLHLIRRTVWGDVTIIIRNGQPVRLKRIVEEFKL
jgi:hypothetical protein